MSEFVVRWMLFILKEKRPETKGGGGVFTKPARAGCVSRGGWWTPPYRYLGTAKVFRSPQRTKDFANNRIRSLGRRRRIDVDVRLALRLCRGRWRRIHNRRVALLFLRLI